MSLWVWKWSRVQGVWGEGPGGRLPSRLGTNRIVSPSCLWTIPQRSALQGPPCWQRKGGAPQSERDALHSQEMDGSPSSRGSISSSRKHLNCESGQRNAVSGSGSLSLPLESISEVFIAPQRCWLQEKLQGSRRFSAPGSGILQPVSGRPFLPDFAPHCLRGSIR